MSHTTYIVNNQDIVYEDMEGEVIIINTQTGTYYDLVGTATDIWQLLMHGCTVADIQQALQEAYEDIDTDIAKDVDALIARLLDERLISVVDCATDHSTTLQPTHSTYQTPQLKIYDDMQDLLTIDPIHDVDESGWPNAKPG